MPEDQSSLINCLEISGVSYASVLHQAGLRGGDILIKVISAYTGVDEDNRTVIDFSTFSWESITVAEDNFSETLFLAGNNSYLTLVVLRPPYLGAEEYNLVQVSLSLPITDKAVRQEDAFYMKIEDAGAVEFTARILSSDQVGTEVSSIEVKDPFEGLTVPVEPPESPSSPAVKAYLGISVDISGSIMSVEGPAKTAEPSIETGDRVLKVSYYENHQWNDIVVRTPDQLTYAAGFVKPGRPYKLTLRRGSETIVSMIKTAGYLPRRIPLEYLMEEAERLKSLGLVLSLIAKETIRESEVQVISGVGGNTPVFQVEESEVQTTTGFTTGQVGPIDFPHQQEEERTEYNYVAPSRQPGIPPPPEIQAVPVGLTESIVGKTFNYWYLAEVPDLNAQGGRRRLPLLWRGMRPSNPEDYEYVLPSSEVLLLTPKELRNDRDIKYLMDIVRKLPLGSKIAFAHTERREAFIWFAETILVRQNYFKVPFGSSLLVPDGELFAI